MPGVQETLHLLNGPKIKNLFSKLYGKEENLIQSQVGRYKGIVEQFQTVFGAQDFQLFSSPGRSEIGGNHTDHNHGKVLTASINLDSVAAAAKTGDGKIRLFSKEYREMFEIDLNDLGLKTGEKGTTALIKGMAVRFKELGRQIGGFNAYVTSDVKEGSGLSSSASVEMLIGWIVNYFNNDLKLEKLELAKIGKYAENVYWKKPSGLLDQMGCIHGGMIAIDFKDLNNPVVEQVDFDFVGQNYSLLIVNTGSSHADLTDDYKSVFDEMKSVAEFLGGEVCRDASLEQVMAQMNLLRNKVGDRAVLRALHFYNENERVEGQVAALRRGDFAGFLELIQASGDSSWKLLQNCYSIAQPANQGIPVALAVTENYFRQKKIKGACRVHGGGFAGMTLVFMPNELIEDYQRFMDGIFEAGATTAINIRPYGTIHLNSLLD
jgi:galactokinase